MSCGISEGGYVRTDCDSFNRFGGGTGENNMSETCLTCQTIGCGGLQYNPYRNEWYCPVFNVKTVADNKTTMLENVNVANGTGTYNPWTGERTT